MEDKRWFRHSNDPKCHKPLVTFIDGLWTVTTKDAHNTNLVRCVDTFPEALAIANEWADEYRAAWVAANMRRAA